MEICLWLAFPPQFCGPGPLPLSSRTHRSPDLWKADYSYKSQIFFFLTEIWYRVHGQWLTKCQCTGVGSHSFLQGIFPTQGWNPDLPHCRGILYQLSHKGSPRILEWLAYRFSSGSSQPRNWTRVSCIAGGFFANWAMREAQMSLLGQS